MRDDDYYEKDRERAKAARKKMFGLVFKVGIPSFCFLMFLLLLPALMGINDAGMRTVIQYPNGTLSVKFGSGFYSQWFGKVEAYPDVITYDFDEDTNPSGATIDQNGIDVQYGDGGLGTVYGKALFNLPATEEQMILLHKEGRNAIGVAYKIIQPVVKEAANQTACLMNSEDGYASKRGIFTQWTKSQIAEGLFQTESNTVSEKDIVTGKSTSKQIAVVKTNAANVPLHYPTYLSKYGITISTFQMNKPMFEEKTMKQISDKREATMAIITAKANAEKAKQDAITAEEKGKADVMKARYEKEVEKERAVVDAEREKQVAQIAAEQNVEVAKQTKLEAEQKKLAASEYKQEQILRGEGESEYKRLVMEADGALTQKLDTYKNVMQTFAVEFGKQKWVPEIQLGSSGTQNGNQAEQLITLLNAKVVQDLGLNTKVK